MNPALTSALFRVRGTLLSAVAAGVLLAADEPAAAAESGALDSARILSSVEVDYGDHSVFYNRIETPVLKPQASRTPVPPRDPTLEEIAEAARIEAKRQVNLWISCTVFGGQFTIVRFPQDGQEVVIQSSIDFNLLAQGFDLETEDSLYNLYLGIGDVPREEFTGQWPVRLLAEAAKTSRSKWQVVSRLQPSADTVRTIEDLHRYFDAHRERLIACRAQREAAQNAHEEWLKANPPVPEDIVVNYFPINSPEPPRPPP
jgi:hypothetical protein